MPRLLAPAKLNLTLEVLARRDDGYHTLRSLMVPVGLSDRIEIEPATTPSFATDDPALEGADNLVVRALAAAGATESFAVRLAKVIPTGGGLGGGSSDAAAILRAAIEGKLGGVTTSDWLEAARRLGSDVPFFLAGTAALVEGVGERVTAVGALPAWWAVIVRPPVAVATAEAYRLLDAARESAAPASRSRNDSTSLRAVDALQRADFAALQAALGNDFHEPISAAYPAIARAGAALQTAGGKNVLLSGSGSCLFALFESERDARACAGQVEPAAVAATFVAPFHHDPAWR
jgi:4-diphosphocytidyl-2-C-methyl-D-erythritol kinase